MNAKLVIATIAGTIVSFLFGWLVFGMLLQGFYASNSLHYAGLDKMPPDMICLVAANFVYALLLAVISDSWAKAYTWMDGAKVGAIVTVLMVLSFDLFMYAFMNMMGKKLVGVDVVLNLVLGAIVGAVIGICLGYKRTT